MTATALDVAAEECSYVGDSYEFDVTAATGAGMHPVYVGTSSRDNAVSAADVPCFPSLQSLYDQVVS